MGFIYRTTNMVTGQKYIGQTLKSESDSYLGSGLYLLRAIKKYGAENFSREILARSDSREELNSLEIEWIEKTNAVKSHEYYNITEGGLAGDFGPAVRQKISKAVSGEKNGFYGKHHTRESMEKRNMTMMKRYGGNPKKGKPRSEKDKIAISEGTRKAMQDPKLREHLSQTSKAWWDNMSPEEKETFLKRKGKANQDWWESADGLNQREELRKRMLTDNPFRGKHHEIVICPHCGKSGGKPGMMKWHFDNCKERK